MLVVVMLWAAWLPARVRAQSGTDVSPAIFVHPDVPTVLRLPDEIADVWSIGDRVVMVKGVGNELYVRPRPDTPAGVEALIEVKTRTLHRIFHLRVVERAEDAMSVVVVPAPAAEECADAAPGASSAVPAPPEPATAPGPQLAPTHVETASATSELAAQPAEPAPTEPARAPAIAEPEPATVATTERAGALVAARFEFSVHAVATLAGTTALYVPGYAPKRARQPHRAFGMRVAGRRPGAWWGVEANVSGEWPAAPTTHSGGGGDDLYVNGPWLRADGGLRVRFEGRLTPTAYAGGGLQAHYRDIETSAEFGGIGDMAFGGVLAGGVGLEYRAGDLLLGLELHVRQGVPADYRSVAALLSVRLFLDQGE